MKQDLVELTNAAARGRNGDFIATSALITVYPPNPSNRDVLVEIGSKRQGQQAPIQIFASSGDARKLGAALTAASGFVQTKSASSAEIACQGLAPQALEALGPGGLATVLNVLEHAVTTGLVLITGREGQEALAKLLSLTPAVEKKK